jgi:predicted NBD/HSP70 family sugar kinase
LKERNKNMALGIVDNCSVFNPDTVIIGGGVGTYFDKYGDFLNIEIDKLLSEAAIIKKPAVIGAKNAEEAVVLGCIIMAKQYEQRQ